MNKPKKVGRPRIVETPEEFDYLVDWYEAHCINDSTTVSFTGMARFLGFVSRESLYAYGKREEFSDSVKRARLMVEEAYELRLWGRNVAGAICALKNHGWSDRQSPEHSTVVGGVIRVPAALTPDEWDKRARERQARLQNRTNGTGSLT